MARVRAPTKKKTVLKAVKRPDPAPQDERARQTALAIAQYALDKKALDPVVIDVRALATYAEFFVILTAESEPQSNAIAGYIEQKMKERQERPIGVEGAGAGSWVLLDYGDVVVHVFFAQTRAFYDLEGLWADAPRVPVSDAP